MSATWLELMVCGAAVVACACAGGPEPASVREQQQEKEQEQAAGPPREGKPAAALATGEISLSADMAEAARRYLGALSAEQRGRAVFPLGADERLRWHYIPQARRGVSLGELGPAQRPLAYGFLATALGRGGLLKVTGIMALEEVLRRRDQGRGSYVRDPGAYYLTVFGEPSTAATWGWRLEGHHLSLNLTLVDGVRPVASPAFLGAAPSRPTGDFLHETSVLGREEELGSRLVTSLDPEQRRRAIVRASAPEDILSGPGARLTALPGLAAARMTALQRTLLDAIVDEATGSLPRELAERERARIAAHDPGRVVFSWAGGTGAREPHYYQVSGPTFLYELDNTQEDATHIHTVWHAREQAGGDFGLDLLRQHRAAQHDAARHTAQVPQDAASIEADLRLRREGARPVEPFRLVGNIYYVGGANIASYLIATSRGLILIDTGPREMEPVVRAGIVKLGFRLEDVEVLLTSHAHWDHVEGLAAMKRLTGARVMALAEEVPALSSGQDLSALGDVGWDPVTVDRVLRDGDEVVLGEVTLRALWTPGHTQGCTTWITTARENGRRYAVAFVGVPAANAGVKLRGNPRHPTIADDLAHSLRALEQLRPDIFLTAHPADLLAGKRERLRAGEVPSPLVNAADYPRYLAEAREDLRQRLRAEDAPRSPPR
ncbi:MAG TPA: subclass B3 metallo-beta-lactamase [Kofleriaceae bacterium]|nr:subclass B3 metallo-beta-lactamase [Kofleriaceae bacterium]